MKFLKNLFKSKNVYYIDKHNAQEILKKGDKIKILDVDQFQHSCYPSFMINEVGWVDGFVLRRSKKNNESRISPPFLKFKPKGKQIKHCSKEVAETGIIKIKISKKHLKVKKI